MVVITTQPLLAAPAVAAAVERYLEVLEQLDKEMLVARVQLILPGVAEEVLVRLVLMLPVLMAALAVLEVIGSL